MKLSDLPSKMGNVWVILALLVGAYIFLFVMHEGLVFRAFLLGNPCAQGQIFDKVGGVCAPSGSQVACGGGTYLSYSMEKGYTCEWSNLAILAVLGAIAALVYFFFLAKKPSNWIPARQAFMLALHNGHLRFPKHPTVPDLKDTDLWASVTAINRIEPKGSWSFTGYLLEWGSLDTILINATTNPGWVENSMDYPVSFGHTNIQKLSKKGQEPLETLKDAAKIRKEFEEKKEEVEEE